ncbi:hypothetical protein QFC22_002965 [Naganishia vaughanmartiniae]|uniref:Uncharacterized protein n=1 Tax=Naganishia vaughanmartiniae TaxID=1424756 RepID=A0ACC2X836_9TREE|nr:hypothetical protein QFC22_002965 [Naganishia vaughanmartiniae]
MLPPDVLEAVEAMERDTSMHNTAVLNVCCPYTSRDEVTTAIKGTIKSVETGEMSASDFLMWQTSSHTQLHFIKTLWPEFGMKEMAKIMLAYQRRAYMSGMLARQGIA